MHAAERYPRREHPMNIWLDTTLFAQGNNVIYQRPDEGACPRDGKDVPTNGNTLTFSISSEASRQHLHIHTFVCVDILHIQQCSEIFWLVCNPTGAGAVAVIDTDLYMLLTCFR